MPISLRANWPLLVLFVVIVIGIGFVVGLISTPGPWFDQLVKPDAFIVPQWISGPLWLLLCIAFGVAGWRLWLKDSASVETRLWVAILILSWWFSPIFFVARAPWAAFVVIMLLAALMVVFTARTWRRDRVSAWLFVPCTLWVAYAATMTGWIAALN